VSLRGAHGGYQLKRPARKISLGEVEAATEWGAPVHIEMSQDRFRDLHPVKDEVVYSAPATNVEKVAGLLFPNVPEFSVATENGKVN
jgi:DNA-binding IscR family transcriptional regulator